MKNPIFSRITKATTLAAVLFVLLFSYSACSKAEKAEAPQKAPQPPIAKIIPKELTAHGHTRIDNYYWLNQRDNPEVLAYLEAENAYKEAVMAHTEDLQEKLFNEIVGRIKQTDMSVPYKDQGYYHYTRYEEGGEYPIYCRKKAVWMQKRKSS